jgi:uncharacterized protein DUF998
LAPLSKIDRSFAIAGVGLVAICAASMIALHRARPELNAVATPLSFYARGPGGWLLAVALVTSGIGEWMIASSLRRRVGGRAGLVALALGGAGMLLGAIAVADPWFPWEHPLTTRGWIHAAAIAVAVGGFAIGSLLVSRDVTVADRWSRPLLQILAATFFVVLVLFSVATVGFLATHHSPAFLGLAERVLLTLAIAWLVVVAPVPGALAGRPGRAD